MNTTSTVSVEPEVRARLALALDVADLDHALRLASQLAPWFGVAKVGLELYSAAGPAVVSRLRDLDMTVFADLKLHDIPTTVGRAARVLGRLGVGYLNFHAAGGVDMLRAGVEGLLEGARDAGVPEPVALGVTVLTSDRDASAFGARLDAAVTAGCGGVVCAVDEIAIVRRAAPAMRTVVPGIRLADGDRHDQARVGTPEQAAHAGADVLVVGRAVTAAADPTGTAQRVAAAVREGSAAH